MRISNESNVKCRLECRLVETGERLSRTSRFHLGCRDVSLGTIGLGVARAVEAEHLIIELADEGQLKLGILTLVQVRRKGSGSRLTLFIMANSEILAVQYKSISASRRELFVPCVESVDKAT